MTYYLLLASIALFGLAWLFKARAIISWIIRLYNNSAITRHMQMRGYELSMRLVGAGWFVFGATFLWFRIFHPISN